MTTNLIEKPIGALLEHISDAVICTDMQLCVNYFNKKAQQVYGIPASEILGRRLSSLISYQYLNSSREQAQQSMTETGHWQGKVSFHRGGGRDTFLLATVVYVYDDLGTPIGLIATLKDITKEEIYERTILRMEAERLKDIIQTQESERSEIGRELHDNINQILAVVKLQLEFALESEEEEKHTLERCQQNVQNVISEIRRLSHRLILPRFAECSLQAELEKMIGMVCPQQPVKLISRGLQEKLIPNDVKETVYRIIQEQLNNIIKHANATKAVVTLVNDANNLQLTIEDNGIGFDPALCRNGVGITNILNRVDSYNGTADINSAPGKGCRLSITIPLQEYP